jgi:hypothetical protein
MNSDNCKNTFQKLQFFQRVKGKVLVIFLLFSISMSAQTVRFEKAIDDHNHDEIGRAIIADSSFYLITAAGYSDSFNGWLCLKLVRTDTAGNIMWIKLIGADSIGVYAGEAGSIIKTSDGNYITTGNYEDQRGGSSKAILYLLKFNSSGDTLWMRTYPGIRNDYGIKCLETPDHGIITLVFSFTHSVGNGDIAIMKTDSNGNVLWWQNYGRVGRDFPGEIKQLWDHGFIITGYSTSFTPHAAAYFVRVDSSGNLLWEKTISGQRDYCANYIYLLSDTQYILNGCVSDTSIVANDDTEAITYYAISDSSINYPTRYFVHHTTRYGLNYVLLNHSSNIVSFGTIKDSLSNAYFGLVASYSLTGNLLWERKIYISAAEANQFNDARITDDGGVILVGETSGASHTQDVWIVKLDSLGCLFPGCNLYENIQDLTPPRQQLGLKIYPNPVTNKATLIIENSSDYRGNSMEILVYNSMGQVIYRTSYFLDGYLPEVPINMSDQASGLYNVRVLLHGEQLGVQKLVKE